jgi:hypothetical protein
MVELRDYQDIHYIDTVDDSGTRRLLPETLEEQNKRLIEKAAPLLHSRSWGHSQDTNKGSDQVRLLPNQFTRGRGVTIEITDPVSHGRRRQRHLVIPPEAWRMLNRVCANAERMEHAKVAAERDAANREVERLKNKLDRVQAQLWKEE